MGKQVPEGMLFSLNGKDTGEFYGGMVQSARFMEGSASSVAYWSDEQGGGRFTPLVARYAVSFIKQCIDNPSLLGGLASWAPLNKRYEAWKAKQGYSVGHWKRTGKLQESIGVIYRGRHSQTIGVRRDVKGKRIDFRGNAKSIPVAVYAAWGEFGGPHQPARPLFGPAILMFVSKHFPGMVGAVEKAIDASVNVYRKDGGSKYNPPGDMEATANVNINNDFPNVNPFAGKNSFDVKKANKAGERVVKKYLNGKGVKTGDL